MTITTYHLTQAEINAATDFNPDYAPGWFASATESLDGIWDIYPEIYCPPYGPNTRDGVEGACDSRDEAIVELGRWDQVEELGDDEIAAIGFTADNTAGYSDIALAALNVELAGHLTGLAAYSSEWHDAAKSFADAVARR